MVDYNIIKKRVTNKIIAFGIVFIAIMSIPFNLITYFALIDSTYFFVRLIAPFLGLSIIFLAFFKNKIKQSVKIKLFLFILFLASLFSLLLGLLDTASLWFVLIMIYSLFTSTKKDTLILFTLFFLSILVIGFLMVTKNPYIPFDYGFEDCQFACVVIKILDFLVIGFLVFYIINIFIKTMNSYALEISEKGLILKKLNISLKKQIETKNRNKLLHKNLEVKNKKLAINTLKLLNRTEFDASLINKLENISVKSNLEISNELKNIIQQIRVSRHTIIWEEFERMFIDINTTFYQKLFENYPDLSKTDKKLCAFIKLNMNTKDIASLLNITIRAVETARYRLRKKLHLKKDENLCQFIENI